MNIIEKLIKALFSKPTLSFHEKMVVAYLKGKKMPLKGHTRIIFTDEETGEERVVADTTNMVTNAVANLLSRDWCGFTNFSTIFPLKNMYSGVICFQNEITENADNYMPPNDITNPMIAHAGQSPNTTVDLTRGDPVVSDIVTTDTSVKWVWSWDSSHGNGTIRTVCLCPNSFGNMGMKPVTADIHPLVGGSFGESTENAWWSEDRSKHFPFSIADDGKTCKTLWVDGTTFKEYTMRHDFFAYGIMRDKDTWQQVSVRTATISINSGGFNLDKSFIFADDDYYYLCTIRSATIIDYCKVKKDDFTVTGNQHWEFTGVSLWTSNYGGFGQSTVNRCMPIWAFDGTNLYCPNSDGNRFYRLNITNNADVDILDNTITISKRWAASGGNGRTFTSPVVLGSKLILGDNYLINGSAVYQLAQAADIGVGTWETSNRTHTTVIRKDNTYYGDTICLSDHGNVAGQAAIWNAMFLSTINVLEEPVTKTNTVAMRIEYTISEA